MLAFSTMPGLAKCTTLWTKASMKKLQQGFIIILTSIVSLLTLSVAAGEEPRVILPGQQATFVDPVCLPSGLCIPNAFIALSQADQPITASFSREILTLEPRPVTRYELFEGAAGRSRMLRWSTVLSGHSQPPRA